MAASDSRPVPIKNTAYRAIFPILDADGDLVTGATGLDSEVSKDCGTFADCTNEATEIATSSGMYYLDLTSTEMNADSVAVIVKTTSSGAKTTPIVLYPQESGDIKVDVQSYGGTAGTFSGGRPEVNTTHAAGTAWGSGAITAASIAADAITDAKVASDVTIASVTGAVGSVTAGVTVTTNNDKTGYGLSSAAVQAIWDALTSALTTVGSIGKLLVDNINATISSRLASASYTAPLDAAGTRSALGLASANLDTQLTAIDDYLDTEVAAIKAKTDNLPAAPAAVGDIPTAAAIADAVWDEAISGHLTAGSTGNALNAAGSAGDPWSTPLPGAYGAGTAGKIIGDNIDAAVSSRLATSGYSAPLDAAAMRAAVGLASANLDTQIGTLATAANLATAIGYIDTEVAAILADTNELQTDWANGGRLDLILDARASQASVDTVDGIVDAILVDTAEIGTAGAGLTALATQASVNTIDDYLDTEIAAIKAKTDNLPASPAAVGDAMTLTAAYDFAKGTTAMTESYATDGAAMTPAQALHQIWALLAEKNIASTTLTAKKLDGSTTAMTFTLNDATTPTAITRAT